MLSNITWSRIGYEWSFQVKFYSRISKGMRKHFDFAKWRVEMAFDVFNNIENTCYHSILLHLVDFHGFSSLFFLFSFHMKSSRYIIPIPPIAHLSSYFCYSLLLNSFIWCDKHWVNVFTENIVMFNKNKTKSKRNE